MRTAAIIQTRMGSTRLSGKVLADIEGKSMVWHVVNRLKFSKKLDEIILAIPDTKENDVLESFAKENKIKYFRGSEENVLSRYYEAAKEFKCDVIVRITSDCPLIDSEIVDLVIETHLNSGADYTANIIKRTFPRGLDVEVFNFKVLERAYKEAKKDFEKEHVTLYIYRHPEIFHLNNVENNKDFSYMRYCVDEIKDLEFVREIYSRLYKDNKIFLLDDINNLLKKHPELMEINKDVEQKEIENEIKIANRKIGYGHPCFIIAEMSANHNQDFERAKEIVKTAAECGADAVKLQTYTPDTLTIDCSKEWFLVKDSNSDWNGKTLYELYKKAYMPWDWQPKLKKIAEDCGIILFSTAYDETAVDFLEKIDVPAYKIASFELTDIELLKKIASTKKPVILSRGMASLEELKLSVSTLRENGASEIAVLHCVTSYPTKPEDMNLATIPDIAERFEVVSGLSDHTLGISAAIASVVLGAKFIEKHFTLRRADGGVDSSFSLEPEELKALVKSVREAEKTIGKPHYGISKKELENAVFRRSLFVVEDIKKGEKFTKKNIRCIRPGYGMAPKFLNLILSKKAKENIKKGTPLRQNLIEE